MRNYLDYSPPGLCFIGTAILGAAGISAGSSLVGGKKGAQAATQAASIQAGAAEQALGFEENVFGTLQNQLAPYVQYGTNALQTLLPTAAAAGTTPIDLSIPQWQPTNAQLASTPGYQFTLNQGLEAIQGRGGVPTANAAAFASNLASTTYQQQYGNYLAQVQNIMAVNSQNLQQRAQNFNIASAASGVGSNAIATGAGIGASIGGQVAQSMNQVGAAQASGVVGSANALNAGLAGVGSSATNAATLLALTGGNAATAAGANMPLPAGTTSAGGVYYPA
jgi:hypothetical protein